MQNMTVPSGHTNIDFGTSSSALNIIQHDQFTHTMTLSERGGHQHRDWLGFLPPLRYTPLLSKFSRDVVRSRPPIPPLSRSAQGLSLAMQISACA